MKLINLTELNEINQYYLYYYRSESTSHCHVFKLIQAPSNDSPEMFKNFHRIMSFSYYIEHLLDEHTHTFTFTYINSNGNIQIFGINSTGSTLYQLSEDEVNHWLLPNII